MKMNMKIRRRSRTRFRFRKELRAGLVIITLALLVVFGMKIYNRRPLPVVNLQVQDAEIREGDSVPAVIVEATCEEKDADIILDRKTKYSVNDFVADINSGKRYVVEGLESSMSEGDYPLFIKLDEETDNKFQEKWHKKIAIDYQAGTLHVKNKYGDWEGNKFLLLDGKYASGWTNIGKDTYYFDKENVYVTGEQKIDSRVYYFGDDGRFDEEMNRINPTKPVVALTFDDGPGAYTLKLLEALEKNDARATFFMMGPRVGKYPETVKRMKEIGCQLGNHTWSHLQLTKESTSEVWNQVHLTNEAIRKIVGEPASVMRAPYGSVDGRVAETVNMPIIAWSVDTLDWESKNVEKIKKEVKSTIKDGDIILMHDIYETTVDATIELLSELSEEGYQFVTVSELAELRGKTLKNGVKYNNFYK